MSAQLFLPRADSAEVPPEKLHGYALNPEHLTGSHKARVFLSALGIGQHDWIYLRDQILERLPHSPVTALRPKPPYGVEHEVRIMVDGLNGETHPVVTGWLVPESGSPRLVTLYVELPRRV